MGEKAAELAPSQPWGDIRGMGNRLRHAYDRIDLDVLWNTVRDRLPSLKADAEQALVGLKAMRDRGDALESGAGMAPSWISSLSSIETTGFEGRTRKSRESLHCGT